VALHDLTPLLSPRTVAIIGATSNPARPGGRALAYLRHYGFDGTIFPINPKYEEVEGLRCFPDLASLTASPDMAVVAVPANRVTDVVRQAQAAGVPALTVYSSGFSETGSEGMGLEVELRETISKGGTLLCGPNSQGVANFLDRMVVYFSSELGWKAQDPGGIGFVSQSGVFGGVMATECRRRAMGLGYLISTGNEAGIDFAEAIAHLARDDRISVIAGYLEGARNADALRDAVALARNADKPVIILKAGRAPEGARAASAHTGALAGAQEAYDAAFREWGVTAVSDVEALYDTIEAFVRVRVRPTGRRIGILTNSGGIGVLAADAARDSGLEIAQLSPETDARIKADLPAFASARNPVDVTLQQIADPESVERHIRSIAADPGVDVVLACFGVVRRHVDTTVAGMARAAADIEQPLVTGWLSGDRSGPVQLRAAGLTAFSSPRPALQSIRALVDHTTWRPVEDHKPVPDVSEAAALIADRPKGASRVLPEQEAKRVLAAAGIPVTRSVLATDGAAAARAAEDIGWPVVLKVESADLPHRSDVGGVALGLVNAGAVRAAYDAMMTRITSARPDAVIDGVSVHETAAGIAELIVGIKQDATFGPLVVVGFGGTLVELLRDSAVGLPPISCGTARALLETLRGYPVLTGARGAPKADVDAIAGVIERVSALALAAPTIEALDINPLIVRPEGQGVVAADALITLRGASQKIRP
jgi:acyl-CoA synthetase (NDP forming)